MEEGYKRAALDWGPYVRKKMARTLCSYQRVATTVKGAAAAAGDKGLDTSSSTSLRASQMVKSPGREEEEGGKRRLGMMTLSWTIILQSPPKVELEERAFSSTRSRV